MGCLLVIACKHHTVTMALTRDTMMVHCIKFAFAFTGYYDGLRTTVLNISYMIPNIETLIPYPHSHQHITYNDLYYNILLQTACVIFFLYYFWITTSLVRQMCWFGEGRMNRLLVFFPIDTPPQVAQPIRIIFFLWWFWLYIFVSYEISFSSLRQALLCYPYTCRL